MLDKVDEIFLPMMPDFPNPVTMTRPFVLAISSSAASISGPIRSMRPRMASASVFRTFMAVCFDMVNHYISYNVQVIG